MSLIRLPDIRKVRNKCNDTHVSLGFDINEVLTRDNIDLSKLGWSANSKPYQFYDVNSYVSILHVLININSICLVRDNVRHQVLWWGFFKDGQNIYTTQSNKHKRPVLFK